MTEVHCAGLNHLALVTNDMDKTVRFYRRWGRSSSPPTRSVTDGAVVQDALTRDLVVGIRELVERLSRHLSIHRAT